MSITIRIKPALFLLAWLIAMLPHGIARAQSGDAGRSALLAASGRADFAQLVLEQLKKERQLAAGLELLDTMISAAINPVAKGRLLEERSVLAELAGDWNASAQALSGAAGLSQNEAERAALELRAASAWINAGQDDKAKSLVDQVLGRTVQANLVSRGQLLRAWLHYRNNQPVQAYAGAALVLSLNLPSDRLSALQLALLVADPAAKAHWQSIYEKEFASFSAATSNFAPYFLPSPESLIARPAAVGTPSPLAAGQSVTVVPDTTGRSAQAAYYQIGVFSNLENAELAMDRLQKSGFRAMRSQRTQDARTLHIVYVAAGSDPAHTLLALKDAGFEAWPLQTAP